MRRMILGFILAIGLISLADAQDGKPVDNTWKKKEEIYLTDIKQLTTTTAFKRAGESYFSPDMKHMIFQAEEGDNPFYQMYIMELATGKHWRISPGTGKCTCGYFHPDGKKVIFASGHTTNQYKQDVAKELEERRREKETNTRRKYVWDFDPFIKIYESNLDGTGLKCLTPEKEYNAEGSYSPDGKQIVYCSKQTGNLELWIMDADGNNKRQLTKASNCYNGGPFFSPDGKRVIFRSDRKKTESLQLYVINTDGTGERALTDNLNEVNWCPYWYADSKHIIYSSGDHSRLPLVPPNYDLYWLDVDNPGNPVRITQFLGGDVLPVFSPDGKKLLWTSTRGGNRISQIFLADFVPPK